MVIETVLGARQAGETGPNRAGSCLGVAPCVPDATRGEALEDREASGEWDAGEMVRNAKQIGWTLRAIRRHQALRQVDLAAMVGVSQSLVSRVERGLLTGIPVDTLAQLFAAPGARLELRPWWDGAKLDRLLDADHAALTEFVVRILRTNGWQVEVEVTFAIYGERGSVDIVAWHAPTRTVLIVEIKTAFGSMEETLRRFDVKVRLARRIVQERFGWSPTSVARLLVVNGSKSNRRHAASHLASLGTLPTTSGWHVRGWLREPNGHLSALWFASPGRGATVSRGSARSERVRRPSGPAAEPRTASLKGRTAASTGRRSA